MMKKLRYFFGGINFVVFIALTWLASDLITPLINSRQDYSIGLVEEIVLLIIGVLFLFISISIGSKRVEKEKMIENNLVKPELYCSICGKVYPEGSIFCAVDGNRLKKRVVDNYIWGCPSCKKSFPRPTRFCPDCGEELEMIPRK